MENILPPLSASRIEFTTKELSRLVVEQTVAEIILAQLAQARSNKDNKHASPFEVQGRLYREVTDAILAKFSDKIRRAMAEQMSEPPQFQSAASVVWIADDFVMPIIMGYADRLAETIGAMDREVPLFSFRVRKGEAMFGVTFEGASIFATEENRKATAFAFAQVVAYAARSVLTSRNYAALGLERARKLAGIVAPTATVLH